METYLVFVDATNNSNKFWSAKVEENKVTVQWGRVGYNPQTKVHSLNSHQQAVFKYYNLIAQKRGKGYQETQPHIDSTRSISEINKAIRLLNRLRSYVQQRNFNAPYIDLLNQYLQIIPTPLGMQINPSEVYQSVADVDHQKELLTSLLPSTTVTAQQNPAQVKPETKTVSLKATSKNFWRKL